MQKPAKDNWVLPPLPSGWELVDRLSETADIAGLPVNIAGLAAHRTRDQALATGSSASWSQNPLAIAYYELLERMAIIEALAEPLSSAWSQVDASTGQVIAHRSGDELFMPAPNPTLWQPAKSNGIAIGQTFGQAAQHALCETIERHLVLGSWYGAIKPLKVVHRLPAQLQRLHDVYEIECYSFGTVPLFGQGQTLAATGTFFWPKAGGGPVVYGFAADTKLDTSCDRSFSEGLQRLCFLDGEEVGAEAIEFSPRPDYHQEFFLQASQQDSIRRWLRGDDYKASLADRLGSIGPVLYFDLTPKSFAKLRVVKAVVAGTLPLVFGRYRPSAFQDCADDRLIHPVV